MWTRIRDRRVSRVMCAISRWNVPAKPPGLHWTARTTTWTRAAVASLHSLPHLASSLIRIGLPPCRWITRCGKRNASICSSFSNRLTTQKESCLSVLSSLSALGPPVRMLGLLTISRSVHRASRLLRRNFRWSLSPTISTIPAAAVPSWNSRLIPGLCRVSTAIRSLQNTVWATVLWCSAPICTAVVPTTCLRAVFLSMGTILWFTIMSSWRTPRWTITRVITPKMPANGKHSGVWEVGPIRVPRRERSPRTALSRSRIRPTTARSGYTTVWRWRRWASDPAILPISGSLWLWPIMPCVTVCSSAWWMPPIRSSEQAPRWRICRCRMTRPLLWRWQLPGRTRWSICRTPFSMPARIWWCRWCTTVLVYNRRQHRSSIFRHRLPSSRFTPRQET